MLMNVLLEEPPALDSGSVSTLLEVISASVTKASSSCTSEANTSVMTSMNAPSVSTSAAALLDVTTYMGPTGANVKTDTRATD